MKCDSRRLRFEQCETRNLLASFTDIASFRDAVAAGEIETATPIDGSAFIEPDPGNRSSDLMMLTAHESKLAEIGLAALNFESATQRLPANAIFDGDTGQPLLSWRVQLLPFLGYGELFDQFNRTEPWDSPTNIALLDQMPEVYRFPLVGNHLPVLGTASGLGPRTVYQAIVGPDTAITSVDAPGSTIRGIRLGDITDGQSNTILFARTELDDAVEWTKPQDLTFDASNPLNGLDRAAKEGFAMVLADGSAHTVPRNVDLDNLTNMILRNDGQFVDFSDIKPPQSVEQNLRQIMLGNLNHESATGAFVPEAIVSDTGQPLLSWRVQLLPFLEQGNLYDQFRLDEPWDSPHNIQLAEMMPRVFAHPDVPDGMTNMLAFQGEGTMLQPADDRGLGIRINRIRDGLSQTVFAVEADADRAVVWTRPDDIQFDPANPLAGVGNIGDAGFWAVKADGSSGLLSNDISAEEMRGFVLIDDQQAAFASDAVFSYDDAEEQERNGPSVTDRVFEFPL